VKNNPSKMRLQNSNVEELKFKITELEQVLEQERLDRQATVGLVEQVRSLEVALGKARHEKDKLLSKLKQGHEVGEPIGTSAIAILGQFPSSPESNLSEAETWADEERVRGYQSKIAELEARMPDDNNNANDQLLSLQTEISMLKADNSTLKKENDTWQTAIKTQENTIKDCQARIKVLEVELHECRDKMDDRQLELLEYKGKLTGAEKVGSSKDMLLSDKNDEIDELRRKLKEEKAVAQDALDIVESVKAERDELQKQIQGFQASRRQLESKVTTLERENRRAKRLAVALETSMQDLKISVEEKAMENDELNRSIMKVMDQANETIEGAKRHSMLISSSPSVRSNSP
jgi:chromosome segregation ATPase